MMREFRLWLIGYIWPKKSYKRMPLPDEGVIVLDGETFWEICMHGNVMYEEDDAPSPLGAHKCKTGGRWLVKSGVCYSTNYKNLHMAVHLCVPKIIRL
jgi:hypothetical protein